MLGDLFEKLDLKFKKPMFEKETDVSRIQTKEFSLPLVNAKDGDNGVMYYGRPEDFDSAEMTIDIVNDGAVSTGNVYSQPQRTGVLYNAYLIKPRFKATTQILHFFTSAIYKSIKTKFGYEHKASWERVQNEKINLPTTPDGKIDFDFMESFIRELEEERIRELEEERIRELAAYLTVSGLADATLTANERFALKNFENLEWKSFRYDEIFNHIEQGKRLKKDDQQPGNIPFVMSGVTNTGVVNYISNPVVSFPKNSITVDIFGNTFYRSFDYGLGDDTGAYWNDEKKYTKEQMLFFTSSIGKSLLGKYSYGHKLRSSQSFGFKMYLPVRDGVPDYTVMQDFINAVQKLVIKDVVQYADRKIEGTKRVIKSVEKRLDISMD